MNTRALLRSSLPILSLGFLVVTGCTSGVVASEQNAAEHHAQIASQRQELEMIPPPSKNHYMAIRSFESWQNPYITVQSGMLTLHILLADANPSPMGAGGMLRPIGARRQDVSIAVEKLGEAMSSIPESAWPYGRVVAVEEAHKTPASQEPVVRRNMERTVGVLNDLGIVAYDITDGSVR